MFKNWKIMGIGVGDYWDVVQLVERLTVNQYVAGSSPAIPV